MFSSVIQWKIKHSLSMSFSIILLQVSVFLPLLASCCASSILKIRELSAQAYVKLLPATATTVATASRQSAVSDDIDKLLARKPRSANRIHGCFVLVSTNAALSMYYSVNPILLGLKVACSKLPLAAGGCELTLPLFPNIV